MTHLAFADDLVIALTEELLATAKQNEDVELPWSGIETASRDSVNIAVISVEPLGVVQFGSIEKGHELTLRILYRLYGQAEEDQDFFSFTAVESAYEMFLLTVAETLRDSFPASDKSLSRLLGDAPHLPGSIFKLLESLCCHGSSDSNDMELYNGDRVTQGLSAVWSLILLRPPIRNTSLNIALQSATHHLEEVRMKAMNLILICGNHLSNLLPTSTPPNPPP